MVVQIFLPQIKLQLRILRVLNCFPLGFDKSVNQIVVRDPTTPRRILQFLQWIYVSFMFLPVTRLWGRGCHGKAMEGVLIIVSDIILLAWSTTWKPNRKVIRLFNALLKFDTAFIQGKITRYMLQCQTKRFKLFQMLTWTKMRQT